MSTAIQEEINRRVAQLPEFEQRRVLDIVNGLSDSRPIGISGEDFWNRTAGSIPKEDADEMLRAIEEDCERIDSEGW